MLGYERPPRFLIYRAVSAVPPQLRVTFPQGRLVLLEDMRVAGLEQPRQFRGDETQLDTAGACSAKHWLLQMTRAAIKEENRVSVWVPTQRLPQCP
jgi:hypothetical protein